MELQNQPQIASGPGFTREPELRLPGLEPREALFSFLSVNFRFYFPNGPELENGRLSERDLKSLAQLIDKKHWQPEPHDLIRALRTPELIELTLKLKTHAARQELTDAFAKFSGLSQELFEKSLYLVHEEFSSLKAERAWRMKCYSLFVKMLEPIPDQVTREILGCNLKQSENGSEQALNDYKIHWYFLRESVCSEGYGEFYAKVDYESLHPFRMVTSDHMYGSIYMDAPQGVILSYKQVPQAIVTFIPDPQNPESLIIRQLQGLLPLRPDAALGKKARYPIRGLARLNWEDALVQFAEHVATEAQFSSTQVLGSVNNKWASRNYQQMSMERASERYDQTARRMGYSFDPQTQNYCKFLNAR